MKQTSYASDPGAGELSQDNDQLMGEARKGWGPAPPVPALKGGYSGNTIAPPPPATMQLSYSLEHKPLS